MDTDTSQIYLPQPLNGIKKTFLSVFEAKFIFATVTYRK